MATDTQTSGGSAAQALWLEGAGIKKGDVRVEAIEGREAISMPYRFEAIFVSSRALKASDIVGQAMKLGIDVGSDSLVVHGVVLEFHTEDPTVAGDFVYRVVVVPRAKILDFNRQNRIFGSQTPITLPEIIQQELDGKLAKQSSHGAGHGEIIQSELRLIGSYPAHNYVVQYSESDLAFMSRLCEHAGVFFFFEQTDSGEKMIFGDNNLAFTAADLPEGGVVYRQVGQGSSSNLRRALSFRNEAKALPGKIFLREYNEMMPSVELLSNADISRDGFGIVVEYGQHFATPDEGNRLAKIRAEEIAVRGSVFWGQSNAPQLRPGYIFSISDHPDANMDGRYVVTTVTHEAANPIALGQDFGVESKAYTNRFEAIPLSVPFRPQRVTPKPVAAGIYNATVDGSGSGERAELDEHGRYKLRVFYDDGTSPDGKASEYVRKAEPYAGKQDSGMHFPLLKDTEVVLAFVNGDPDRPIIVGAVANPLTPNVVNRHNQTRNRIASTSGVLFEIEDGPAAAAGGAAKSAANAVPAQTHFDMPQAVTARFASAMPTAPSEAPADGALLLHPHFDSGDQPTDYKGTGTYARISVPGSAKNYLRLGGVADTDATDWSTGLTPMNTPVPAAATSAQDGDFETLSNASSDDKRSQYNQGVSQSSISDSDPGNASVQGVYNQAPTAAADGKATDYTTGVLIGTDQNLITNVKQSALTLVGKGSTTQVNADDWTAYVKQGAFTVTAHSGIVMTSGDASTPTNIELTAYGYVRTVSKGTSYYWSHSDSVTQIDANKYQSVIGDNISFTKGLNKSTVIKRDEAYKIGGRLAINVGAGMSIFVAVDMKMFAGGDISWGIFNLKMVTGADMKFVLGMDFKMVTQDTKIVTVSKYEIANVSNKASAMNVKWYGLIYKDAAVEAKNNQIKTDVATLKSQMSSVTSLLTDMYAVE